MQLKDERSYGKPPSRLELELEDVAGGWRWVRGEPVTAQMLARSEVNREDLRELVRAFRALGLSTRGAVIAAANGGMEEWPGWAGSV